MTYEMKNTRDIVQELLRRIAGGDHDGAAALFAEHIDWRFSWPSEGQPVVPWIRPRSTRAEAADHFRALDTYHVPELNGTSVTRILVDGADAVVIAEIVQTVRESGVAYTSPVALHITVEDGLITRYHIFEDSLTIARAMGAA
ncbi:nuclear transport factor 2 family protein [Nonomuraea sp. KM88]|uniref:nuclear transport factor 2 family protein n=1 Tax=Nonomuraea sp. KM88 TaxID=3457427 RepID=UPI003FCCD4A5